MPIPAKLKKRWDIYPTLEDVLSATQNLSVSPFGTTENGLLDFRGIKLESGLDKNYAQTYELPVSLHRRHRHVFFNVFVYIIANRRHVRAARFEQTAHRIEGERGAE